MTRPITILFLLIAGVLGLFSCSSGGISNPKTETPTAPELSSPGSNVPDLKDRTITGNRGSDHYLWSYHLIRIDPKTLEYEIISLRNTASHWNILSFLEQSPCMSCFKVAGILPSGTGTLLLTIQIINPFGSSNFTGFDVRGIAMFNASHTFPEAGLVYSDPVIGDLAVLNPEGWTSLYNPTTAGYGPGGLQGYIKGNLATETAPNGTLNAYKRFISGDLTNHRNAFLGGDSVKVTYEVGINGEPFLLGYAVDASWAHPINSPVIDPMTDFGPEANCTEAWKIEFVNPDSAYGLTACSGQVNLIFDIFDWQGPDNLHLPRIECPQLFDGEVETALKIDGPGFSRYEATIENVKHAPKGSYRFLVSKEAAENDPISKPWLDLTAYHVFSVYVYKAKKANPFAEVEAYKQNALIGEEVLFDASDSHDGDCDGYEIVKYEWDWENDGVFEEGTPITTHAWSVKGNYTIQLRVTDDEGKTATLYEPPQISITEQAFNPVDITPPWLNFSPRKICIQDNMLYLAGQEAGLHIFEMTDPTNFVWKGWVDLGGTYVIDVVGDLAFTGSISGGGLSIIDINPPIFAHIIKQVNTEGTDNLVIDNGYAYITYGSSMEIVDIDPWDEASVLSSLHCPDYNYISGLAVEGDYACAVSYTGSAYIIDISPPETVSIIKTIDVPGQPWDVAMDGGYAYIADLNTRMLVVDLDPIQSASVVQTVATPDGAESISVYGDYAYVSCGESGVQIIDISTPESAFSVKTLAVPGTAHSVEVSGNYGYISDGDAGIPIMDLSPPESASIVAIKDTTYSTQDVTLFGDYAIAAAGRVGVEIIDIQSPESPWIVKSVDTPGSAQQVVTSGSYAYVADTEGGLQIINLATIGSAYIIKTVETPSNAFYVAVSNGYAYVICETGFLVVDVNPIGYAHIIKEIEMDFEHGAVAVTGGYAYVVGNYALSIININPPESAYIVKTIEVPYWYPQEIAISGNYAFVADYNFGVAVIDLGTPESPSFVNIIPLEYNGDLSISGGYAYVCGYYLGIIDIDPPESAFPILGLPEFHGPESMEVSGKFAYGANDTDYYPPGFGVFELW